EPEPCTSGNKVSRLMQQHCEGCHRAGDIAPFSLSSYADAYRQRQKIARAVELRRMPPWKPVPGFGDFADSRRLADADVAVIRAWVDAGAPEGDPRDLPPPRTFSDTWALGAPDEILTADADSAAPAGAPDVYPAIGIPAP